MKITEIICLNCSKKFVKPVCFIKQHPTTKFCKRFCYKEYYLKQRPLCLICKKPTKEKRIKLCSRKCSGIYRRLNPIKTKTGYWYENGYKVLYILHKKGIKEHRKIIEKYLGRELDKEEYIHHINGVKDDNRIENLQLMNHGEHSRYHRIKEKKEGKHLFGGYHNN